MLPAPSGNGPLVAARSGPLVRMVIGLLLTLVLVGCGGNGASTPTAPGGPPSPAQLTLQGNPESGQGATWTYVGLSDGVFVDLQGILFKPSGPGPFPAVVISHGNGGSANGYSRALATDMVQWGLVCIATNYTHAGGVPLGAPGTSSELGASEANVRRARAASEILRTLGYVDMSRVAAHGHSMGAFVTAAVVAAHPFEFRVASHTAGGATPDTVSGAAPSESLVRAIRAPYQLHHGSADTVVPLVMDERLASIFEQTGVVFELHVYAGAGHNDVSRSAQVLDRVRAWYASHGLF